MCDCVCVCVSHTVVMTLSDPVLNLRIFFLSACEALIFTKALGCRVFPGGEGGASCCGHTNPLLSSESLDSELEAGDSASLRLDSDSPGGSSREWRCGAGWL